MQVQGHSTFEEKYEFLFKHAIRNIHTTTPSELTKYATLIAISVDLENVPTEEQQAFHQVYSKYKTIVAEETEKTKWMNAYNEVKGRFTNIYQSISIPPEQICKQQEVMEQIQKKQEFRKHYSSSKDDSIEEIGKPTK